MMGLLGSIGAETTFLQRDGGVDGGIDQDALGSDRLYVQAKRYKEGNVVGPGAIPNFCSALDQFKANKGLFVTTSESSSSAVAKARGRSKRIVLINGNLLAKLMIRYGIGCRVEEQLYIKRLDEELFEF